VDDKEEEEAVYDVIIISLYYYYNDFSHLGYAFAFLLHSPVRLGSDAAACTGYCIRYS
jgi:hypothetical protein